MKLYNIVKWGSHPQFSWKTDMFFHPLLWLVKWGEVVDGIIGILSFGFINTSFSYELLFRIHMKKVMERMEK